MDKKTPGYRLKINAYLKSALFFLSVSLAPIAIAYIEIMRALGRSPPIPFLVLFAAMAITAGLRGTRWGMFSAATASAYIVYASIISFGPPTLVGSGLNTFMGCVAAFSVSVILGQAKDSSQYLQTKLLTLAASLRKSEALLSATVTERTRELEQANQDLVDSESRISNLLENAPDAAITVNSDGDIRLVNAQAEKMFGYPKTELCGKHINSLLPLRYHTAHRAHLSAFFENPVVRQMGSGSVLMATRRDGTSFPVEVSLSPVKHRNESLVTASVRDISERVLLQEQLSQAQKMEAVGQLAGGIAHDFNNLLAVINGNLEFISSGQEHDQDISEMLGETLEAVNRAAELTRQLLGFSRQQLLSPKVACINETVNNMERMLKRVITQDVDLKVVVSDKLWLTMVDTSQLENAIMNLAINACDAMPDGGELTLRTSNVVLDSKCTDRPPNVDYGEYVLLCVTDNGHGISSETLPHVFEPFYSTKRESGERSGLGLSMVRGFVQQSNGYIDIDTEVGSGTTIKIYLPRTNSEAIKQEVTDLTEKSPTGHESILVVDDLEVVRKVTVRLLEKLGYRTYEASDGAEAMAILEARDDIDLLFTDILMPGGMKGPDLARLALQRQPDLKVLFMTGYAEVGSPEDEFLMNGKNLLSKPFHFADLARSVRDRLDGE